MSRHKLIFKLHHRVVGTYELTLDSLKNPQEELFNFMDKVQNGEVDIWQGDDIRNFAIVESELPSNVRLKQANTSPFEPSELNLMYQVVYEQDDPEYDTESHEDSSEEEPEIKVMIADKEGNLIRLNIDDNTKGQPK
jgi:hypothetical protein